MNTPPINPERLAALLDGRLSSDERARLLADIANSDDAIETLGDAAAVLRELEVTDSVKEISLPITRRKDTELSSQTTEAREAWSTKDAKVQAKSAQSPPRDRWRSWPLLAAAAVLLFAVGMWNQGRNRADVLSDPAMLVSSLGPAARDASLRLATAPWTITRGDDDALAPRARAVRFGARATELALAAQSGDLPAISLLSREVAQLLRRLPGGGPAAGLYVDIAADSAAPNVPTRLRSAWTSGATLAGYTEATLGAWLVAARVAVAVQARQFFHTTESRAAIEALTAPTDLDPATRDMLARIRQATGDDAVDWTSLENDLRTVLGKFGS